MIYFAVYPKSVWCHGTKDYRQSMGQHDSLVNHYYEILRANKELDNLSLWPELQEKMITFNKHRRRQTITDLPDLYEAHRFLREHPLAGLAQ